MFLDGHEQFELDIRRVDFFFRALHFLHGFGKCDRLHGHDYRFEVRVSGEQEEQDVVVDFQDLKSVLLQIKEQFEYKILVARHSPHQHIKQDLGNHQVVVHLPEKTYHFPTSQVLFLPIRATTVEELTQLLYTLVKERFPSLLVRVSLFETLGNKVTYGDR